VRLSILAAAAFAALAFPALAAAPQKITAKRAGHVKLGARQAPLHNAGVLGPIQTGCELDPGSKAAVLRPPLKGAVNLGRGKRHRVREIIVTGGAKARGVGMGDRRKDILAAFPEATFDTSTQEVFRITLGKTPKGGGGPMQMELSRKDGVVAIAIPRVVFCE
jgi:hypothetical protein